MITGAGQPWDTLFLASVVAAVVTFVYWVRAEWRAGRHGHDDDWRSEAAPLGTSTGLSRPVRHVARPSEQRAVDDVFADLVAGLDGHRGGQAGHGLAADDDDARYRFTVDLAGLVCMALMAIDTGSVVWNQGIARVRGGRLIPGRVEYVGRGYELVTGGAPLDGRVDPELQWCVLRGHIAVDPAPMPGRTPATYRTRLTESGQQLLAALRGELDATSPGWSTP